MKQVTLTPDLRQKLQDAAGAGVDVSKHAVYEAVGLNTKPVRKDHPLFKGARHSANYLNQMAGQLNKESLPLQVMHADQMLPAGRVFYGAVNNMGDGPELRLLFWVDPLNEDLISLIDSGTLDQVSVSTLAKNACCSTCGWDFFGASSTTDNIFSGVCGNDHQLGKDGAYAKMDQLDQWFEMSLVGRGGATGAFICSPANSLLTNDFRLAASGKAASWLTLSLSSDDLEPSMTLDELATLFKTQLTAMEAKFDASKPKNDPDPNTNGPSIADLQAKLMSLEEIINKMKEETKAPIPVTPAAHTDDAGNFLLDGSPSNALAKKILVMSGDPEAKMPTDAKEVLAFLEVKLAALSKVAKPDVKALEAASGTLLLSTEPSKSNASFKAPTR